ncbi:APC family permease [Sulfuracidifex tepidarius]|nr:APC family permease [Sulfuracidifex tepidarius]
MQFVRNSSGLVKRVSLLDAVMLNVANMGAGLAVFTGISPYVEPGSLLWLSSIITFLVTLPLVILYTFLLIMTHRTGGDYVWLSRYLNGKIGSIMGIAIAFNMPPYFALSAFFSVAAINSVLTVMGITDHSGTLLYLANHVFVNPYNSLTLSQELFIYVLSGLIFSAIVMVNVVKPKWGFKIVSVFGLISLLGLLVGILAIATATHFHADVLSFLEKDGVTPTPYTGPSFSLASTLFMIPYFASFAYIWLYAGPAVSGEISSSRGIKYNIIIGSLLTLAMITLPFYVMDLKGGYSFDMSLYPSGTYNFWSASMAVSSPLVQTVIGIGLISWEFFVMSFGIVVFARYVFAFSFDRLFPEVFSRLNKEGSPVYAHFLDLLVTLIFLSFPIISPEGVQALYSYTPLAIAYLFLIGLVGVKLGVKIHNKLISVLGVLSSALMVFMGYEAFTNPYFGVIDDGKPFIPGIIYIVSLIGTGALIYSLSRVIHERKGINIDLSFKEIPPE